jgi:hypothetical protein
MTVRLSALCTGRSLLPRNITFLLAGLMSARDYTTTCPHIQYSIFLALFAVSPGLEEHIMYALCCMSGATAVA